MKALSVWPYSYTKILAIWFTVAVTLAFIVFGAAIIPGPNIMLAPTFITLASFIHLCMFFWVMWTYIMEPDPPDITLSGGYDADYEEQGLWHIW